MKTIQFLHHILAVISLIYFVLLIMLPIPLYKQIRNRCMLILGLLISQFLLGLGTLAFQLPVAIIVTHNLMATLQIILITSLHYQLSKRDPL